MASPIDTCNRALAMIGTRSSIASMDEGTPEANACSLYFNNDRQALLRLHNWAFARKRITLSLLAAAAGTPENPSGALPLPETPWLYSYAWPVDCLRVRAIYGGADKAISSDVDATGNQIKVILTNQQQADLIYTTDITNPDLWDCEFEDALTASLAADVAIALTGDKGIAQMCMQVASNAILQARTTDSIESPTNVENVPSWVAVRGYTTSSQADAAFINSVMQ